MGEYGEVQHHRPWGSVAYHILSLVRYHTPVLAPWDKRRELAERENRGQAKVIHERRHSPETLAPPINSTKSPLLRTFPALSGGPGKTIKLHNPFVVERKFGTRRSTTRDPIYIRT
ncbi:hypothetical protein V497_04947 [Pseudogymnoascus sp. VKM F-4516 (FW-969)]|nr:hypothetical protein V497_04947 [Pseudogymnoascus sp. VKM F-4516 (FW-969)]